MTLSEEKKQKILGYIQKHLKGEEPYEVLLFGSYATGKAHSKSDIDIAIKAQQKLSLSKWQKLESALEESDIIEKIDVVDFHRASEGFQKIILESAKPLS